MPSPNGLATASDLPRNSFTGSFAGSSAHPTYHDPMAALSTVPAFDSFMNILELDNGITPSHASGTVTTIDNRSRLGDTSFRQIGTTGISRRESSQS